MSEDPSYSRRLLNCQSIIQLVPSWPCLQRTYQKSPDLIGRSCVIEYGSGSSLKIRQLLQALSPAAYVPVDISKDYLLNTAKVLSADFTGLDVFPVCADFTQDMVLPTQVANLQRVGFFPVPASATLNRHRRSSSCSGLARLIGSNGYFLIGVDCKRPVGTRAGVCR